jgi:hypothetical protein
MKSVYEILFVILLYFLKINQKKRIGLIKK